MALEPGPAKELSPKDVSVCLSTGIAMLEAGRFDVALGALQVVADSPGAPDVTNLLASCHHGAGRKDRAAELYQRSLEKNPAQTDVLTNLGEILLAKLEYAPALVLLKRAIALDPKAQDPYANRARGLIMQVAQNLET